MTVRWICKAGNVLTGSRLSRIAALVGVAILFCVAAYRPILGLAGHVDAEEASAKPAATVTVKIDNFTFAPDTITVAPGTTVTWINGDDIPHTVTEKNREFKSQALDTDDKFSHTFSTPGEVDYFCSVHPRMTGRVIVKAAGSPS